MRRRAGRQYAVQLLFQRDYHHDMDIAAGFRDFWADNRTDSKTLAFAEALVIGVINNLPHIDELITKSADNWDLMRIGGVERNAMRLATYEMLMCHDIPPVVSINEAVDLTKSMCDERAGKFVNGILDRIQRDIGRPLRTGTPRGRSAATDTPPSDSDHS